MVLYAAHGFGQPVRIMSFLHVASWHIYINKGCAVWVAAMPHLPHVFSSLSGMYTLYCGVLSGTHTKVYRLSSNTPRNSVLQYMHKKSDSNKPSDILNLKIHRLGFPQIKFDILRDYSSGNVSQYQRK